jgi:hypothetical protein
MIRVVDIKVSDLPEALGSLTRILLNLVSDYIRIEYE